VFPFYSDNEKGTVMDLKDFIQSAVSQIVEGMVAAQSAAAAHGATLNPGVDLAGKGAAGPAAAGARVSNIAFDVAITAAEGSGPQASPSCAWRAAGPTCMRRAKR